MSQGRGWFADKMEVISGGMAPRPSTPQPYGSSRQQSMSAPNSPARSVQSASGNYVSSASAGISRLPSQDSLDRSIHNDSGHGKSTAQIIRDLKQANARLSAKTASMEAQFMNQLNATTRQAEDQAKKMQLKLLSKEKHLEQLKEKNKDKESQLSKIKEESAFQRHTISDLKNQLYQLQSELDNNVDRQQMEELAMDNQQMARAIQDLQADLEAARNAMSSSAEEGDMSDKAKQLQAELEASHAKWKIREDELMEQIESLQFTEGEVVMELRQALEDRDAELEDLRMSCREAQEQVAELQEGFDRVRQEASTAEQYRRDEADDLRILHDAQEQEIEKLREDLDDARRELELRDQEIEEKQQQLKNAKGSEDDSKFREELERTKAEYDEEVHELKLTIQELKDENGDAIKALNALENQLNDAKRERDEALTKVQVANSSNGDSQAVISGLEQQVKDLQSELDETRSMSMEKRSSLEKEINDLQQKLDDAMVQERKTQNMESELTSIKERLRQTEESEKEARQQIEVLEREAANVASARSLADNNEVEELKRKLAETEEAASLERDRLAKKYDEEVKRLGQLSLSSASKSSGEDVEKIKKQLREAQVALVALDDDKKKMSSSHRELLSAVEKKKEEIQRESAAQLEEKSKEIEAMKAQLNGLQNERSNLLQRIEILESQVKNGASDAALERAKEGNQELQLEIAALKQTQASEMEQLRAKLKDRDTTINALLRSSGSSDQMSVRSAPAPQGDYDELKKAVSSSKETEAQLRRDISSLKKDLDAARADAKRWKDALETDATRGDDSRYTIALLRKEIDDSVEKLQESDRAIENLVNQSISQENHVRELKTRISSLIKDLESLRLQKNKDNDSSSLYKAEIRRLQQESEIFAGQIIEQDEELEGLKRKLQSRENEIRSLRKSIQALNDKGSESDPEMEKELLNLKTIVAQLQADLKAREKELSTSQSRLAELQSTGTSPTGDSHRASELQAELDELQEASEDNRKELRELRRELWEAKQAAGEAKDLKIELSQAKYALAEYKRKADTETASAKQETRGIEQNESFDDENLRERLDEAIQDSRKLAVEILNLQRTKDEAIQSLETKLAERERTIEVLKSSSSDLNDEQVKIFQEEIEKLHQDISSKNVILEQMKKDLGDTARALETAEIGRRKLNDEIQTIQGEKAVLGHELKSLQEDTPDALRAVPSGDVAQLTKIKEGLEMQVANLKTELASVSKDLDDYELIKSELEKERESRDEIVKELTDDYERQLNEIKANKDATIDELRKTMDESRDQTSSDIGEMINAIKALEGENTSLREQMDIELTQKNQQIYALEHTLHAQEQLVESMRAEMDQLQSGMEQATEKRRGEIEEMQQEVMSIETRAKEQEREIVALKMQLEESKLEHKAEVVRLKEELAKREEENPELKSDLDAQKADIMTQVRDRLEQLKWKNTSLQTENQKLSSKLERAVIEVKRLEAQTSHHEDTEKEVARLREKVKTLEGILKTQARPPANPNTVKPVAPTGGKQKSSNTMTPNTPPRSTKSSSSKEQKTATVTPEKRNSSRSKRSQPTPPRMRLGGLFKRTKSKDEAEDTKKAQATQ